MVRTALDRVRKERHTWQTSIVERCMVGISRIDRRQMCDAEIAKRSQPVMKDRPDLFVSLKMYAADPAAAVSIDID